MMCNVLIFGRQGNVIADWTLPRDRALDIQNDVYEMFGDCFDVKVLAVEE